MRIKSDFKDYYDYQATIYGVDKSITYNRSRIRESEIEFGYGKQIMREPNLEIPNFSGWVEEIPDPYNWSSHSENKYTYNLLVVGDKVFLVTVEYQAYGSNIYTLVDENHPSYAEKRSIRDWSKKSINPDKTTELCRRVGHPVFIVCKYDYHRRGGEAIIVHARCPILKDVVGLPAVYPAEQIYQDLSYFLTNKMKNSPDESPISVLTDKEKIIQHGMDVKQSFRHRK